MKVAVIQMSVADGDPEKNLETAARMIDSCEAELILLPELWTTGYAHESWARAARTATPRIADELSKLARARGCWIGGSMITAKDSDKLANRFWLLNPDGAVVTYDKGHLFSPMREDEFLEAGTTRVRQQVSGAAAALSICYDLRFPEMYRNDALDGAELFLVVSAWPRPRQVTMSTLALARAVENQAFLVICNRVGLGVDGTYFCGRSAAYGPDGAVLLDAGEAEGVFTAEIDLSVARNLRKSFPVLSRRVPSIDTI